MLLPVADGPALRRQTAALLRRHRAALSGVVTLHNFPRRSLLKKSALAPAVAPAV